jgi:hypothetical protein
MTSSGETFEPYGGEWLARGAHDEALKARGRAPSL